jgi:adenosylcobyric acid synthase
MNRADDNRRMTAKCVMVLGTTSGAGKSWLATALCRRYARQGLRVAPFKAQNMSNNARVVAGGPGQPGGEIGSAQYFQALAARTVPEVRMNPLLLKPERDTHSQVVLLGQVSAELTGLPWRGRSERVWPQIAASLDALRAENDVVVIEGAGSPAEINLMASDIVNLRVARHAAARCLLVTDIDRGGAFAHLYGTHALMDTQVRRQLRGFVLNKFRGDEALLAPAPQRLQELTGVPTLAVLPMDREHGLPDEDGVFDDAARSTRPGLLNIAVLATPHISNLDEFQPLRQLPGVHLLWTRDPAVVAQADWLILPGSKHTRADLAWLQNQGLAEPIRAHAQAGKALLAICGGLQLLGEEVADPLGVEGGSAGASTGLGLLPLHTEFGPIKRLTRARCRFEALVGPWQALSGLDVVGYEIRAGRTRLQTGTSDCRPALPEGLGWQRGPVLALYLHGLFENPNVLQALFGTIATGAEATYDRLADMLTQRFAPGALMQLLDPR